MLQKEVSLFIAWKNHFPFLDAKNKFFCEATTKLNFHIAIKTFFKNTIPP
jgi:hypothetical protein